MIDFEQFAWDMDDCLREEVLCSSLRRSTPFDSSMAGESAVANDAPVSVRKTLPSATVTNPRSRADQ